MQQRLQKLLASAGIASRRSCEALIAAGRVTVNGEVVARLGAQADPDIDDIRLDGKPISGAAPLQTIALNKPVGFVTTVSDPHAEHTVMELVKGAGGRLYPIGRLDADSAGLLLLTNDGELAQLLTHPSHHVPKTYRVLVRGEMSEFAATDLRHGVQLEDGMTAPARVEWVDYNAEHNVTVFDITITEGRNRQVRRMLEAVGYPVLALTRMRIGALSVVGLAPGTWRRLRPDEVDALRNAASAGPSAGPTQERHPLENEEPQVPDTVIHPSEPPSPAQPPAEAPAERRPKHEAHTKPGGGHTKAHGGGRPHRSGDAPRQAKPGRPDPSGSPPRDTFGAQPAAHRPPQHPGARNRPGRPNAGSRPGYPGKPRDAAPPPNAGRPKDRPKPDWSATRPIEGHPGLGKGQRPRPPRPYGAGDGRAIDQGGRPPWAPRPDASRRGQPPLGKPPGARPAGRPERPNQNPPAPPQGRPPKPARPQPERSARAEELREQARRLAEALGKDGPEERSEQQERTTRKHNARPKKGKPDAP